MKNAGACSLSKPHGNPRPQPQFVLTRKRHHQLITSLPQNEAMIMRNLLNGFSKFHALTLISPSNVT
jgi:hypothetical protein